MLNKYPQYDSDSNNKYNNQLMFPAIIWQYYNTNIWKMWLKEIPKEKYLFLIGYDIDVTNSNLYPTWVDS